MSDNSQTTALPSSSGEREELDKLVTLLIALTNSTGDFIWAVDPVSFGFQYFNTGISDYFLNKLGIRIALGMRPEDLFTNQEYIQMWRAFFRRALDEGTYQTDYVTVTKTHVLQLTFGLLRFGKDIHGISIFGKDITERRRLEIQMEEKRRLLETILDNVDAHIYIKSDAGRYLYANPHVCKQYGRSLTDIIGHSDEELLPPEIARRLKEFDSRVFQSGTTSASEEEVPDSDGNLCHFWSVKTLTFCKDNVPALIGFSTDITELKKAETALKESEKRLLMAQEAAQLVVWDWDLESNQMNWSAECERVYGVSPSTLKTFNDWRAMIHPDDLVIIDSQVDTVIASSTSFEVEFRISMASGETRWLLSKGQARRNAAGKPYRVSGINLDITRMRQLRQERDEAYRNLELLSSHIQDDMEQLRRELAREVHDEIGASLTGIRMQIEALAGSSVRAASSQSAGQVEHLLNQIDQAAVRARAICTRLRPPMLDHLGLVSTCRWYLTEWSQQTGIRITNRLQPLLVEPGDTLRTDLFRVLQELLTNVARHSGATRVTVTLSLGQAGFHLRVRDNGRGFPEKPSRGFGLIGIRERLRRHGGELIIDKTKTGSAITANVPRPQ